MKAPSLGILLLGAWAIVLFIGAMGYMLSRQISAQTPPERPPAPQPRTATWLAKVQHHNVFKLVDGPNCIYIAVSANSDSNT